MPGMCEITTLYEILLGDRCVCPRRARALSFSVRLSPFASPIATRRTLTRALTLSISLVSPRTHTPSGSASFGDAKQYMILPCHSTLTTEEQKRVFNIPPAGIRKIVISTNIAETSITIQDAVCVVDTGRVKENRYDSGKRMAALVETFVSMASAKQRRGRAGRVRAGTAYHLFSSHTAEKLRAYTLPEMLRVPLEEMVLQIKVLDLGAVREFLGSVRRVCARLRRCRVRAAAARPLPCFPRVGAPTVGPRASLRECSLCTVTFYANHAHNLTRSP